VWGKGREYEVWLSLESAGGLLYRDVVDRMCAWWVSALRAFPSHYTSCVVPSARVVYRPRNARARLASARHSQLHGTMLKRCTQQCLSLG
jgi:hypothetical protein